MIEMLLLASAPLLLGWLLDIIFGDPLSLPHPVVWMGKWIAFGEHTLNKGNNRKAKGALFAVCSIILVYLLTRVLLLFAAWLPLACIPFSELYKYNVWELQAPYILFSAVLVFYCLAGHTLRKEVRMVFEAVDRSVEDGRKQVARIVGRDTSELSAQECRTAALETLAENLSDGVIAPLFWFVVLGVPGMVMYKMINTFDSMIGYQNERYKDFGCWAAKIDDLANYVPARLTALLMVVAIKLIEVIKGLKSYDIKECPRFIELMGFVSYYGPQHASPNSGWPEAALAGILNCRFGGPHNYFGEFFYKPYIGTNPRQLTTSDMRVSLHISLVAECLMIMFLVVFPFGLHYLSSSF